jgi:hypothetical protein
MLSPIYSLDQTDTYKGLTNYSFYRHLSQFEYLSEQMKRKVLQENREKKSI